MRFWLAVMALAVGLSLSGFAQKNGKPFKAKNSGEFKVKDQSSLGKNQRSSAAPAPSNGNSSARNLQAIEREGTQGGSHAHAAKKVPASVLKPEKNKANPRIDFNHSTATGTGLNPKAGDPYRGRLKKSQGR